MSVEGFPILAIDTVSGVGPYSVHFSFSDPNHVVLRVFHADGTSALVDSENWTLTPTGEVAGGWTGGTILLTGPTASVLAGLTLRAERVSTLEQGWSPNPSPRERSLAEQLDWMTRAIQEVAFRSARSLQTRDPLDPIIATPGAVVVFDEAGKPTTGLQYQDFFEARDKAAQWATNPEDTEVDTGQYSALHHAKKSAASATAAAGSETATAADRIAAASSETASADNATAAAASQTASADNATAAADSASAAADSEAATAADRIAVGIDAAAAAADRVQTGLDAAEAAAAAEVAGNPIPQGVYMHQDIRRPVPFGWYDLGPVASLYGSTAMRLITNWQAPIGMINVLDGIPFFLALPRAGSAYTSPDYSTPISAAGQSIQALRNVAQWSPQPPLTRPPGFPIALPCTVTRTAAQTYTHDFDWTDYKITPATTYYVSPTGDDGNDGLSAENPKTLNGLVTALNAAPATVEIILAAGEYTAGLSNMSINFDCNLLCLVGRAILRPAKSGTWTLASGYTNVYRTPVSGGEHNSAIDLTEIDDFGVARRLKIVGTLAAVEAEAGTCRRDGSFEYVHTYDSRAPDADVWVFQAGTQGWRQSSARQIVMQNIDIWGYEANGYINHTGAGQYVFENCSFLYARGDNNFEIDSLTTAATLSIHSKTRAAYGVADGLSYRGAVRAIEIDCFGVYNGWYPTGGNNNGSTGHNSAKILRINGVYRYNSDRNVHDINTTKNWLIGCEIGNATNGSSDPFDNATLIAGNKGTTDETETWAEGCTATGGAASDAGAYGYSRLTLLDCTGFDTIASDSTGIITTEYGPLGTAGVFQTVGADQPAVAEDLESAAFSGDQMDGNFALREMLIGATGLTFATVVELVDLAPAFQTLLYSTTSSGTTVRFMLRVNSAGALVLDMRVNDSTAISTTSPPGVVTAATQHCIAATVEIGTGGAGAIRLFVDGTLVHTASVGTTGTFGTARANFIRIGDYTGSMGLIGDMRAILLASGVLSDVDVATLSAYLGGL